MEVHASAEPKFLFDVGGNPTSNNIEKDPAASPNSIAAFP
jgi:hypothetical protein